jgi:hypothetical protein
LNDKFSTYNNTMEGVYISMELSKQPAFEQHEESPYPPEETDIAKEFSQKVFRRNSKLLDHALASIPGITVDQFVALYTAVINARQNQRVFRFISVSRPAPDGACVIKFHNDIPKQNESGLYSSIGEVLHGVYHIPGMVPTFPGMVATDRAIVFGDSSDPQNGWILRTLKRAKRPKLEDCFFHQEG